MQKNTTLKPALPQSSVPQSSSQNITTHERSVAIEQSVLSAAAGELDSLVAASVEEQYDFILRLQAEWRSGSNRFDKRGEAIFTATHAGNIIGVCGINQDPYTDDRSIGRLRHLYVDPHYRNHRLGYRLVASCTEFARPVFTRLRLRMARADTADFYRQSGFVVVNATDASHEMWL